MINRLYRLLFAAVLFALAGSASAVTYYSYDQFKSQSTTIDGACTAAFTANPPGVAPLRIFVPSVNQNQCQSLDSKGDIYSLIYRSDKDVVPTAPDCSSKTPYSSYQEWPDMATAMASQKIPTQVASCKIDITKAVLNKCVQEVALGKYRCYWSMTNTGEVATTQDPISASGPMTSAASTAAPGPFKEATNTPDQKCPNGSVSGGMAPDGMTICVGTGTAPPPAPTPPKTTTTAPVSTSNSDGSTSSVSTSSVTNADGSVTTTTKTVITKPDGTTTTSSAVQTSAATSGAAGRYDDPKQQDDLCARNPNLSMCKNSAVYGVCQAISCDGDAIQCATLRAAATMQCKQAADDAEIRASSQYQAGVSAMTGALDASLPTKGNGSTVDVQAISTTGWLGSGSFFKDKVIALPGGQSLTIPFSQAANAFLVFRAVAMVVASLISMKIMRESITGV